MKVYTVTAEKGGMLGNAGQTMISKRTLLYKCCNFICIEISHSIEYLCNWRISAFKAGTICL